MKGKFEMGIFDKIRAENNNTKQGDATNASAASSVLLDMLSRYLGIARQRQLVFGEQIVRNRDWHIDFI
jgi:hypothetical protein